MDISVIIVSWNVKGLLEKCLASLHTHTRDIAFEVIVVDNASSDGTAEWLKKYRHSGGIVLNADRIQSAIDGDPIAREYARSRMTIITNQENLGFSAANNQGIKESSGKYILLLNPDTELTENSLKKVFDKIESDASIGVLGCTLHNPDGTLQPSVRRFPRLRDIVIIFFKLYKLFPSLLNNYLAKNFDYDHPPASSAGQALTPSRVMEGEAKEVDQVMGAFFCIRRSVIDHIGVLDDQYFIWFEEVDFCARARKAGFKVVYWPGTAIIHHGGQSFSQVETLKKQWWFFKSAWRYFLKRLT